MRYQHRETVDQEDLHRAIAPRYPRALNPRSLLED
jgi:hypothetical protein